MRSAAFVSNYDKYETIRVQLVLPEVHLEQKSCCTFAAPLGAPPHHQLLTPFLTSLASLFL